MKKDFKLCLRQNGKESIPQFLGKKEIRNEKLFRRSGDGFGGRFFDPLESVRVE